MSFRQRGSHAFEHIGEALQQSSTAKHYLPVSDPSMECYRKNKDFAVVPGLTWYLKLKNVAYDRCNFLSLPRALFWQPFIVSFIFCSNTTLRKRLGLLIFDQSVCWPPLLIRSAEMRNLGQLHESTLKRTLKWINTTWRRLVAQI